MTATVFRTMQMVSIAAVISLVSWAAAASAQETVLVQGEVVELSCYMTTGGRAAEYQTCARLHAKQSVTFGVVTDAGDLFLLVNQSADRDSYEAAKKLAGRRGTLSGRSVRKQGVATLIVESAEGR